MTTSSRPLTISDHLHHGAESAITARELCDLLGLRPRDVSAAVERERRAGKPICASSSTANPGYYLAANQDEMRQYCVGLNRRAGEIQKTRRACLKTLEALPDLPELPPIPDLPEPPDLQAADLPEPAELPPIPELPADPLPEGAQLPACSMIPEDSPGPGSNGGKGCTRSRRTHRHRTEAQHND